MGFTVARSFIILLISRSLLFFSLFFGLNKLSNSPLLIFFFFLRCTQTQTHPHTNTSIQTNQHRDTLAKKKKHKDTQTPTHKQTQMDKQQRDRLVLIGMIRACGSCLIGARGSRLIKARGYGSCLIGAREIH